MRLSPRQHSVCFSWVAFPPCLAAGPAALDPGSHNSVARLPSVLLTYSNDYIIFQYLTFKVEYFYSDFKPNRHALTDRCLDADRGHTWSIAFDGEGSGTGASRQAGGECPCAHAGAEETARKTRVPVGGTPVVCNSPPKSRTQAVCRWASRALFAVSPGVPGAGSALADPQDGELRLLQLPDDNTSGKGRLEICHDEESGAV